jgi:hypothetical protein
MDSSQMTIQMTMTTTVMMTTTTLQTTAMNLTKKKTNFKSPEGLLFFNPNNLLPQQFISVL